MKRLFTAGHAKQLCIFLIALVIALSAVAGPADAMFLPAPAKAQEAPPSDRTADLSKIQTALESQIVQQRLLDLGLSPQEAMAKTSGLSDAQVHQFASNIESLQAGGRGSDDTIIILLLVLLIVILI